VLTTAWWGPTGLFDVTAGRLALELPRAAAATWSPDGTRVALAHAHDPWIVEDVPGVVSLTGELSAWAVP
jgi:hypothetical protein